MKRKDIRKLYFLDYVAMFIILFCGFISLLYLIITFNFYQFWAFIIFIITLIFCFYIYVERLVFSFKNRKNNV